MADIEKQAKQGRRRRRVQEEEVIPEQETDEEVDESELEIEEVRGVTAAKGRATPGRRNVQEEVQTGNVITRPFSSLQEYFRGVRSELDKVTWPTREETVRLSRIVLVVTVSTSIVLGIIAFAFNALFNLGIAQNQPWVFLIFFVVVGAVVFGYMRFYRGKDDSTTQNYNSRLF